MTVVLGLGTRLHVRMHTTFENGVLRNGQQPGIVVNSSIDQCEFRATSVMIYHHGASLSEQHTDLLCTKQDLSHTSRFVDESSPKIARYRIRMPTARTATLSVTTSA